MTKFTTSFIASSALLLILILAGVSGSSYAQPVPPCDPNAPETCRYRSDLHYEVGVVEGIELVDSSRNNYRIPLRIQYPIGLAGPRPVVIWNHGGNPSANGNTRSENWGRVLAAAGYIVIHPSRVPVENPEDSQCECTENGFNSPEECAQWLANLRFGPQNTHFIIDNLTRIVSMAPRFAGLFDINKIVVAGHSAGTTTVLANAGATQQWVEGGQIYNERDDRPIAFLATGPMGPLYAGFRAGFGSTSFVGMDRPFMFITGVGDETGEPPESRTTGWLRSPASNKVLSWDTDRRAVHETMDIDKCDTPTRRDHCRWIASAGLAFLDAVVRERPEARSWIVSDSLKLLSGGAIEIHRR